MNTKRISTDLFETQTAQIMKQYKTNKFLEYFGISSYIIPFASNKWYEENKFKNLTDEKPNTQVLEQSSQSASSSYQFNKPITLQKRYGCDGKRKKKKRIEVKLTVRKAHRHVYLINFLYNRYYGEITQSSIDHPFNNYNPTLQMIQEST